MSSFTEATFLEVAPKHPRRRAFRAVGGFRFYVGFVGSTLWVDVPDGHVFDISADDWLLRLLPTGWVQTLRGPAAVHDLLRQDLRYAKLDGDAVFLTAMGAAGTPWPLRALAFVLARFNRSRGA